MSLFDDWGPKDDSPFPLNVKALSKTQLSQVTFLFGGVGDGNNAYHVIEVKLAHSLPLL